MNSVQDLRPEGPIMAQVFPDSMQPERSLRIFFSCLFPQTDPGFDNLTEKETFSKERVCAADRILVCTNKKIWLRIVQLETYDL